MKQENKIENFIGIYDNYLLKDQCEDIIKLFKQQKKFNTTLNRQEFEGASINNKKDDVIELKKGYDFSIDIEAELTGMYVEKYLNQNKDE